MQSVCAVGNSETPDAYSKVPQPFGIRVDSRPFAGTPVFIHRSLVRVFHGENLPPSIRTIPLS